MRAEKSFGCLAAATVALVAVAACTPIVRREAGPEGSGGSGTGGSEASGGVTGTGGATGFGGVTGEGGMTDTGGTTESGGTSGPGGESGAGGTTSSGGMLGSGGATGSGGTTGGGLGGTTSTVCGVSTSYGWASTQALMDPVSDGSHSLVGIKAPTIVLYNSRYHVFATVVNTAGSLTMQYASFADWSTMGSATVDFLDNNAGFAGGRSQPQVFNLKAKNTWYLITQSGAPAYSTNADITDTAAWTKPTNFFASTPAIVTQNAGTDGIGWTDFWVICDNTNCHMFFTNQKGYLFRSQTAIGSFPSGFSTPVIVMQSSYLVEGARVYKVNSSYLMLVEGTGSGGRYIGAWTATALDGKWTPAAETEANPFAGAINATFSGTKWTRDIGHGELIRSSYDETMTIDNCNMRYLFAGKDPFATAKAEPYPWKLGLLVRSQ